MGRRTAVYCSFFLLLFFSGEGRGTHLRLLFRGLKILFLFFLYSCWFFFLFSFSPHRTEKFVRGAVIRTYICILLLVLSSSVPDEPSKRTKGGEREGGGGQICCGIFILFLRHVPAGADLCLASADIARAKRRQTVFRLFPLSLCGEGQRGTAKQTRNRHPTHAYVQREREGEPHEAGTQNISAFKKKKVCVKGLCDGEWPAPRSSNDKSTLGAGGDAKRGLAVRRKRRRQAK